MLVDRVFQHGEDDAQETARNAVDWRRERSTCLDHVHGVVCPSNYDCLAYTGALRP